MEEIERVARALCGVDGFDPEGSYEIGEWTNVVIDNEMTKSISQEPVTALNWKRYEPEARRFMAAFKAMNSA